MPAGKLNHDNGGAFDLNIDEFEIFGDIILVKEDREEKSRGGIIIPDAGDAQRVRWGVVIKCGPGRMHEGHYIEVIVKPGDRVMFGKWQSGGEPVKIAGIEYLQFRMGDLVGRMNAKPAPKARKALKAVK